MIRIILAVLLFPMLATATEPKRTEGSSMTGPVTVGDNAKTGGAAIEVLPGQELKGPLKIEVCDGRVIISKD